MNGPRITDAFFFTHCFTAVLPDCDAAARRGDFRRCRALFAAYVRNTAEPERFFSASDPLRVPDSSIAASAEDALRHRMVSVQIPHQFDGPVDWTANPTYNGYREWTWQLNRHAELLTLARAYRQTGDKRYGDGFAELFNSWVRQAVSPDRPCSGYETKCWRTIECGIRQLQVWPEIFATFIHTPVFTDELLTDWCKSVWEHGERLRRDHRTGNWLIMEMTGLAAIGIFYPFLSEADEWYSYALRVLEAELTRQVYPDGFQFELSTGYQGVLPRNYLPLVRLMRAYSRPVPDAILRVMREILAMNIRIARPDGKTPDINDGSIHDIAGALAPYLDLLPDPEFLWTVSGGKEGTAPESGSHIFPYAGIAALRTGRSANDTWLLFDGAPFGAGHQHEDKLNLLIYADGRQTLTEAGIYAYDTSEMRAYVLSSRAHNTVLVDGQGQNRRASYKWHEEDILRPASLAHRDTGSWESLRASYDEGYGPGADRDVRHERSVYFCKKPPSGLRPFVIAVDRLYASNEHDYTVLWHLDAENAVLSSPRALQAGTLHLFSGAGSGVLLTRGQTFPELQGWICNSAIQMDYRPVWCAEYLLRGKDIRFATVFYPDGGEVCPVLSVEAGTSASDDTVTLCLTGSRTVMLSESVLWHG